MDINRIGLRSLALLFVCASAPPELARGQAASPPSPTRFQSQIDGFLQADSIAAPNTDGVAFVGSSIFRLWTTLGEQMATLPVFNRAFGGSRTPDVLFYMDHIVLPYRPRFVVYYCGSNDVSAGEGADAIGDRIQEFHKRLQRELPMTRMFFVSVLRAPEKRNRWSVVDSINAQMRQYGARAKNFEFIDVNPTRLDAKGEVRGELYLPDSLHYRPEAYVLLTNVIKPVLQHAWAAR